MPLPVNFDVVTVQGTYVNLDGTPATGTVTFTANVASGTFLKDTGADVMILPMKLSVKLDGQGAFTIALPATDDPDIAPNGFTYAVNEQFGGGSRSYSIQVPLGTGPIDLISVAPVQPVTAAVTLVQTSQIGVAGGVAGLDSDGDVNDAAGNKVLGTGDLAAVATSGQASDLGGLLGVEHAPATSALAVHCIAGVWQPRPTTRTDVTVFYVAHLIGDPDPADFIAGTDIELRPTS